MLRFEQQITEKNVAGSIDLKNSIVCLFKIFICLVIAGCAGSKDGVAPMPTTSITAPQPTTPLPTGSWEYELNFSEKITSVNNWDAVLDTSDFSEHLVLANGWKIEVSND